MQPYLRALQTDGVFALLFSGSTVWLSLHFRLVTAVRKSVSVWSFAALAIAAAVASGYGAYWMVALGLAPGTGFERFRTAPGAFAWLVLVALVGAALGCALLSIFVGRAFGRFGLRHGTPETARSFSQTGFFVGLVVMVVALLANAVDLAASLAAIFVTFDTRATADQVLASLKAEQVPTAPDDGTKR